MKDENISLVLTPMLLPTDKSVIGFDDTRLCLASEFGFPSFNTRSNFQHKPHHLYLCSTLPIGGRDWFIDTISNKVYKNYPGNDFKGLKKGVLLKISFTTDPKLVSEGVPAIDGNTKAGIIPQFKSIHKEVNFLTEFCKRWNDKDKLGDDFMIRGNKTHFEVMENKIVDMDNGLNQLFEEHSDVWSERDKKVAEAGYNQALQQQAGGFSLEDMRAMAVEIADWKDGYTGKSDNRNLDSVVKDFIQSLTKESRPSGDIVIELNDGKLTFK